MESKTIYEIEDKKYTVITRSVDKTETIDKLYDIICQYIISQMN